MKTDLISRSELFNKLATVPIKAESVETTTEIFKIINSMPVESVGIAESVVEQICDKYCKFPHIVESDNELDRICDNCPLDELASDRIEPGSDLISRQDAIECCSCLHPEDCWAEIKALPSATSQNLTKPNKTYEYDLISRADAIEAVMNTTPFTPAGISAIIESLPSAEAVSREAILSAKFHPLPYTHVTPKDVEVESYKRGWNDALDAVADNAPSAETDMSEYCDRLWKIAYERGKGEAVQGEWIPVSERLPENGHYFAESEVDE